MKKKTTNDQYRTNRMNLDLRRANQLRHGDDLMMGGEFFAFMFQKYHAPIRLTTMGSVECTVRGISPQTELMSGEETIV
ncbi:hypothetical protein N7452_009838 [Penicillium brevicompactum]|uniref:Uncharacterized protein n=1 Tax=Penicillium brevicompactum TaxID=5074 RepID=A0A9W9UB06_PENBR|nr:hypothetical protein N7452_009838 [Penicillium brevicompactum]